MDEEEWEEQYRAGEWSRLTGVAELPHHAIVAGYAHKLAGKGRLVDAGCGGGALLDYLNPAAFDYIGFDISPTAIDKAKEKLSRGTVTVSSFDRFTVENKTIDVIVFNESLYCAASPLEIVDRYRLFLKDNGFVIISIFQNPQETSPSYMLSRLLEKACDDGKYHVLEVAEARNPRADLRWRILVLS